MNKLFFTFLTFLFCFACKQKTVTSTIAILPFDPMVGVWEFAKAYTIANGDTIYIQKGNKNYKIFYGHYFIWTAEQEDSTEWNAFGTYKLKNDTLIHNSISGSVNAKGFVDSYEFIIKMNPDKNSFSQIMETTNNDTTLQFVEYWKRLE